MEPQDSNLEVFSIVKDADALRRKVEPWTRYVIRELSGLTVDNRQAQRLSGLWLLHLIHQVLGTLALPKAACTRQSSNIVVTVPRSHHQHMQLFVSDVNYRRAFDDLVNSLMNGDRSNIELKAFPASPTFSTSRGIASKSRLTNEIRLSRKSDSSIWIIDPYLKISRYKSALLRMRGPGRFDWITQSDDFLTSHVEISESERHALAAIHQVHDTESLISTLIPLMLPVGYAESLWDCIEQLDRTPSPPRVLYTAIGLQSSLLYQVASAHWGNQGSTVCVHQHGGHYGIDERHAIEDIEVELSDKFFTFGWSDTRVGVQPLVRPFPERSLVRRTLQRRILLMSVSYMPFVYRYQPFCLPAHAQLCLNESRVFIKHLLLRSQLIVRCGELESDMMDLRSQGVEREAISGVGSRSASRSSLVVHNYLSTSWLETLALDVPTLCFVPKGIHRFRSSVQPFADALTDVGILHHSGADAAKFVNQLNGNPDSWWNSSEVQEARQAFVARYANFSDDWLQAWSDEFERLLAE